MTVKLFSLLFVLICAGLLVGCTAPTVPAPTTAGVTAAATLTSSPIPATPTIPLPPPYTPAATPTAAEVAPFEFVLSADDVLPGFLRAISVSANGSLVLASTQGAAWLPPDGRAWNSVTFRDGLVLGFDAQSRLWRMAPDGSSISAWDGQTWREYGLADGWIAVADLFIDLQPVTLLAGAPGEVWLATARDVRRFDGRRWRIFPADELGLPPSGRRLFSTLYVTAAAPDGTAWAGNCYLDEFRMPVGGAGLRRWDGRSWQKVTLPEAGGCISALAYNGDTLWAAREGVLWGLNLNDPELVQWYVAPAPGTELTYGAARELLAARDGAVWLTLDLCSASACGSQAQRWRLQNGEWQLAGEAQMTTGQTLLTDSRGQAWLFTVQGLFRMDGVRVEPAGELRLTSYWRAPDGRLWLLAGEDGKTGVWREP